MVQSRRYTVCVDERRRVTQGRKVWWKQTRVRDRRQCPPQVMWNMRLRNEAETTSFLSDRLVESRRWQA